MILPQTYIQSLVLLALSLLLLGSWPVLFKKPPRWRFELFSLDFGFGVFLTGLLYTLTLGSLGLDGFSFVDDILHVGKTQWIIGFAAGGLANLGIMLLLGAMSVAGISVAVTIGVGLSLILGLGLPQLLRRTSNPLFLFVALALMLVAILCAALVHSAEISERVQNLARQAQAANKKLHGLPSAVKAILLSVVAGLLLALYHPLVARSREGEIGLGPYSCMFLVCLGVFCSAPVLFIFFINLPVEGEPLELNAYFKGTLKTHFFGLLAGAMWCTGMLIPMVVNSAEPAAQVSKGIMTPLTFAVPLLSALWGFGVLKELPPNPPTRVVGYGMLLLLAATVALMALATAAVKAA